MFPEIHQLVLSKVGSSLLLWDVVTVDLLLNSRRVSEVPRPQQNISQFFPPPWAASVSLSVCVRSFDTVTLHLLQFAAPDTSRIRFHQQPVAPNWNSRDNCSKLNALKQTLDGSLVPCLVQFVRNRTRIRAGRSVLISEGNLSSVREILSWSRLGLLGSDTSNRVLLWKVPRAASRLG